MLVEGKPSHSKPNAKTSRMVVSFFEAHVLGIMTEFSNSIDNALSLSSSEKLRCVKAIEQMIILAKSKVSVALPQVRSDNFAHYRSAAHKYADKGMPPKRY
jgi:serine/threonine-protein kinase ATR